MAEFKRTKISVTSRASAKIGDNYFTFEETLEDNVNGEFTEEELAEHKQKMWDEANADIDNQILEVKDLVKKK